MRFSRNFIILTVFAMLLGACANQPLPPDGDVPQETIPSEKADMFVGEVAAVKDEMDGSTVTLTNKETGKSLGVVLNTPNLGPDSQFDFSHIERGNTLKVYGEMYEFDGGMRMSPKIAKSYLPIEFAKERASSSERKQCESLGGTVRKSGKAQFDMCVQPYSDAGEYCQNKSDCFGRCTLANSADHTKPGDRVDGVCEADNSRFGCTALVSGGKYEHTICID